MDGGPGLGIFQFQEISDYVKLTLLFGKSRCVVRYVVRWLSLNGGNLLTESSFTQSRIITRVRQHTYSTLFRSAASSQTSASGSMASNKTKHARSVSVEPFVSDSGAQYMAPRQGLGRSEERQWGRSPGRSEG